MGIGGYTDLDTLIEAAIQEFEAERERYWKQDPENYFMDLSDGIASLVLEASDELVAPAGSREAEPWFQWEGASQLLDGDGPLLGTIQEQLQLQLAWQLSANTRQIAARCMEVAREVVSTRPSEPVLRYLRRLSRCYVAGFYPECIILCRAVLENALVEVFSRKRIPLPATAEGKSSMAGKLDAAVRLGWLTTHSRGIAMAVWKRGSKAAHEDPTVTQEVFGTVQMTLGLLRELSSA
jgi:hypothetical protein